MYSNKFVQVLLSSVIYQQGDTINTWCYAWTLATSWCSIDLKVVRFIVKLTIQAIFKILA